MSFLFDWKQQFSRILKIFLIFWGYMVRLSDLKLENWVAGLQIMSGVGNAYLQGCELVPFLQAKQIVT